MATYEVTDKESGRTFELTGDSPPTQEELMQLFDNLPAENLIGREGNAAAVESVLKSTPPLMNEAFRNDFPTLSRAINSFFMNLGGNANDSLRGMTQRGAENFTPDKKAEQEAYIQQYRETLENSGVSPEEALKLIRSTITTGEDTQAMAANEAESQAITNEAINQAPVSGIAGLATSLIALDPINLVGLGMIDKAIRAPQTVGRIANITKNIVAGGAAGFAAGQTTYVDEEVGLSRDELTAITTGAGALLTPLVAGGVGWYGKVKHDKVVKEMGHRLTNYENTFNLELLRTGGDRKKALAAARSATGLKPSELKYVADMTNSVPPTLGKNILGAAEALENNAHMRSVLPTDMMETLSLKGVDMEDEVAKAAKIEAIKQWAGGIDPLFGGFKGAKSPDLSNRVGRLAGKGVREDGWLDKADFYVGSMKTRLKNYSPKIANELTKMDKDVSFMAHKWTENGAKFFDEADKWHKLVGDAEYNRFVAKMYTNRDEAIKLLKGYQGTANLIDAAKPVFKTLDDIAESGASIDGFVGKLEGHFPRRPSGDRSKLPLIYRGEEEVMVQKFAEANGDPVKTAKLINSVVQTPDIAKGSGSTLGYRRAIRTVNEDQVPAYAGIRASYDSYVNDAARVIGRKRFFDSLGADDPFVKLTGETLETPAIVRALQKQPLDANDAERVANLLQARFGPGEMGISKQAAMLKDLSHIVLLGDIKSTMTQLADLYANMHRNGVWNAFIGTFKALRGASLDKETVLGLNNMVIDMAGTSKFHKFADKVLTGTGFRKIDNFGKTAQMEAALSKWRKIAVVNNKKGIDRRAGLLRYTGETFDERWAGLFDTPESLAALKNDLIALDNFKGAMKDRPITDNIGLMLWDELSTVQPISISDMPEGWARGGRLKYTLQSFTLKQLDIMRNDIYNNLTQASIKTPEGRRAMARATQKFLTYGSFFTGTQYGVDRMKEHFTSGLTGKEVEDWEDTLLNASFKAIGLNKYTSDQFLKDGDLWSLLASFMGATLAAPSIPFEALVKGKPEKLYEFVPFAGRTLRDMATEDRKAQESQGKFLFDGENDAVFGEGFNFD